MRLRTMTTQDVAAGLNLNRNAGWNQTAADWERFLHASPDGCFVVECDGQVCGTVATILFGHCFAWIGMVLVDAAHRGKGIGTRLLHAAIDYLEARKIPTIKLDATPEGKPLYEKLGFVSEYEIERWVLRRPIPAPPSDRTENTAGAMSLETMQRIFRVDGEAFGADRSFLLESLHDSAPEMTLAFVRDGVVEGYTFGRHGLFADHMGPWMATNSSLAGDLLRQSLSRSVRDTIVVDCLTSRAFVTEILTSSGFTPARRLTRMYRGPNASPGHPEKLCAIMGPEFG